MGARAVRILYTHTSSLIGGGNKVLLKLFDQIDRSVFQPVSVIPEPGPIEHELRRLEVPYVVLDLRPRPRLKIATLAVVTRLAVWCLRKGVRMLHANDPLTYRAASLAVSCSRAQRVCHIHHPGQTRESLRWALKRRPNVIITPSAFMGQEVAKLVEGLRVEAVWNPIDVRWFSPEADVPGLRTRIGFDSRDRHVVILAALAPHKGHECFLRMAAEVLKRIPRARFHIVGSAKTGSLDHEVGLRRLAAELGVDSRVRFWGFLSDESVRDFLRASDLFVLPSREEGFGLSIAEAQACEVPVLSSAIRPLDEVVHDGRTGYLIPPSDYRQFAARAILLLGNELLRRRMGEAGRKWVVHRFSQAAFQNRIFQLYQDVARNSGAPHGHAFGAHVAHPESAVGSRSSSER